MYRDPYCELCGPGSRNPYRAGTHEHWEWCREATINSAGLGRMPVQEFNLEAKRLSQGGRNKEAAHGVE